MQRSKRTDRNQNGGVFWKSKTWCSSMAFMPALVLNNDTEILYLFTVALGTIVGQILSLSNLKVLAWPLSCHVAYYLSSQSSSGTCFICVLMGNPLSLQSPSETSPFPRSPSLILQPSSLSDQSEGHGEQCLQNTKTRDAL